MLDGIDYYPKRKKRSKLKFFWLLLALALVYVAWIYIGSLGIDSTSQSTSIVISTPGIEEEAVEILIESVEVNTNKVESKINESLDEVIQTYETSSLD